jgi:hypothetical protein
MNIRVYLFADRSYTDLPSPDIVAAQGALVSVGSSYVTYIDKKGQVRLLIIIGEKQSSDHFLCMYPQ